MANFKRYLVTIAAIIALFSTFAPVVASAQIFPPVNPVSAAIASYKMLQGGAGAGSGDSCIPVVSFSFVKCVAAPLSQWTGAALLTMGGAVVELSGALFDFGVNHVITNFRDTLDKQTGLMGVINSGWTFFRDIANILIIGIFVFIAISLILGLKEYGQKKLVARVLIIAVLMNFSLLFTKIIIDASNFIAYSIYRQTLDTNNTGTFSVAENVLKPLKVTSLWQTKKVAEEVFSQEKDPAAGAVKVLIFGIFGFLILVTLAFVIFYGAFLILARAIMLIILMLTAPIAYASYLSPNLEASNIGWTNWWRSLINNAAFAPLMMIFLTISILVMKTASVSIGPTDGLGAFAANPTQLQDGWKVLFIYILGTGLLYVSFRLSSSLAGSISGINLGQGAIRLPLAFGAAMGFRGAGFAAQRTVGAVAAKKSQQLSSAMDQARLDKDWKKLEELRKQKKLTDKAASSSFNLMNTQLGKALAGKAGLGGAFAGESKKGGFNAEMHDAAVAAEEKAKAAQLTKDNEKKIREEAANAALQEKIVGKEAEVQAAKAEVEKAKTEQASIAKEVAEATAAATANAQQREPEIQVQKTIIKEAEGRAGELKQAMESELKGLREAVINASGPDAHKRAIQEFETARARHESDIKEQDNRIEKANKELGKITGPFDQKVEQLTKRHAALDKTIAAKHEALERAEKALTDSQSLKPKDLLNDKAVKAAANKRIGDINDSVKEYTDQIAADTAGHVRYANTGGDAGAHIVQHHFDTKFKKKTGADRIAEVLKEEKADSKPAS